MNNFEAVKELNQLLRQRKAMLDAIERRDLAGEPAPQASEAMLSLKRQIEALERAVQALSPAAVSFTAPSRTVGPARGERSR